MVDDVWKKRALEAESKLDPLRTAAELMLKACHATTHTSLESGLLFLHQHHPAHCGGKNDPFNALRACSCSLNQLISSLLHGKAALQAALRGR